jgi:serine/threonine-protein kinase RsbW
MKIEISSDLSQLNQIDSIVERICEDYQLFDTYHGCLTMAIQEAVKNAIIHGNKMDSSKKVSVEFSLSDEDISVFVSDQGEGFDFQKEIESLSHSPKGNGLEIMKLTSDGLEFSNNGSTVEMSFNVVHHSQYKMNEKRRAALLDTKKQTVNQGIKRDA